MASWGSPRLRSYRDTSPTSPVSPLSPSTLPQWLRRSRPRTAVMSRGRLKFVIMALACLALGWMATSMLGPDEDFSDVELDSYYPYSGGILTDPSGFGLGYESDKRPGIIGSDGDEDTSEDDETMEDKPKDSSISGALADLHHAMSNKIQSWNPYFAKQAHHRAGGSSNKSGSGTGGKNTSSNLLAGETVKDGVSDDERLGARTRIGKCTILFSGNSFWERCIRTHEQHDKVHGYRLHVLRQQLMDDVWSKPAYILSLLLREMSKPESERLDWLFWTDADTIILNPYVPIETFLPPYGEFDDVHLIYSNDWNGLNNGVFPVRVNQWAVQLFSAIVSYRHFKPEDPLQFRDQSAMNTLMQHPDFAKHIVQAPQRWFNAYEGEHNETLQPHQVRRGDLLVHFAGVPAREERMGYWLDRAEQRLDDWEIPVKSTSYPQEARDFWNQQRQLRKDKKDKATQTREEVLKLLTKTEQRLKDYGDRLNEDQTAKLTDARDALAKTYDQEATKEDVLELEKGMNALAEAFAPLETAVTDANKRLLQSAHEAIFAAEKDLLDGGFHKDVSTPELESVSASVKSLKTMIMSPEEGWNRRDVIDATNALTEARAKLQESTAEQSPTEKSVEKESETKGKTAEEGVKEGPEPEPDQAKSPKETAAGEEQTGDVADADDRAGKDGAGKDGAEKDGAGKDGAGKDGAEKDGAGKDGAGKDGAGKESAGKDSADKSDDGGITTEIIDRIVTVTGPGLTITADVPAETGSSVDEKQA